ncbi:MAG TPA: hypothetical protein VJV23_04565 [Candidatus Polarisedimenticolia bacterium]|nr:hypothetical protein [Candidatus Polarisedimenticolia bacterium]
MGESSSICPRGGSAAPTEAPPPRRREAATRVSLLESLQSVIERTYDLDTGVRDIGRFVIGDQGYRELYGPFEEREPEPVRTLSADPEAAGARTLLRQAEHGLAVCIYYPDSLVSCLERHDPCRSLDHRNVDAFAVLVEELDHFLMIAERYRSRGEMSLLELELHANVTKHLVMELFVARLRGTARLMEADRAWIRFHLFDKAEYADPDPDVRARYREASRLAARYLRAIEKMEPAGRVTELRRFHRMAPQAKRAHISRLAAA